MRDGRFPRADDRLDDGGLRKLAQVRTVLARSDHILTSPAAAARQTAEAVGADAVIDEALRDIDAGAWAGQALAELHATAPDALAGWLADPAAGTPGGETMAEVAARAGDWLGRHAGSDARIVAVTHPAVIRAAVAAAIGLPLAATFRIDIAPLSVTILSYHRGWRLQALRPA